MFSLERIKQKKFEDRAIVTAIVARYKERKRPLYKLNCNGNTTIIAEIKKASPSKGVIKIVDPVQQAILYQQAGAGAISVLTDSHYFGGSFDDLYHVANVVSVPILCKEFICYKEQIDTAYILGADMILCIAAMLTAEELYEMYTYTLSKGLLPLVEVHSMAQLETVLQLNPKIIMVNMRNLNTLSIDYKTGIETLKTIPQTITKICASSIDSPQALRHIKDQTGVTIFLVGTALMQSENPAHLLQEFCNVC